MYVLPPFFTTTTSSNTWTLAKFKISIERQNHTHRLRSISCLTVSKTLSQNLPPREYHFYIIIIRWTRAKFKISIERQNRTPTLKHFPPIRFKNFEAQSPIRGVPFFYYYQKMGACQIQNLNRAAKPHTDFEAFPAPPCQKL